MRDAPHPASVDVLASEVREQLAAQRNHLESLEAKAGVCLGFAGLLVAAAPETDVLWVSGARFAGVVSATFSLLAFFPRRYPLADLAGFREEYIDSEPSSIRMTLLDTHLKMLGETVESSDHKSARLRTAIAGLVVAITLTFAGLVVESVTGGSA